MPRGSPLPGLSRPEGSLKDSFYMIVKILKFPLLSKAEVDKKTPKKTQSTKIYGRIWTLVFLKPLFSPVPAAAHENKQGNSVNSPRQRHTQVLRTLVPTSSSHPSNNIIKSQLVNKKLQKCTSMLKRCRT